MVTKFLNYFHDLLFLILALTKYCISNKSKNSLVKVEKRAMLICNGPSLKFDLEKIFEKRKGANIYAMNFFATTASFQQLKPEFYVFADPMFWRTDVKEEIKNKRRNLIKSLSKVNWKMTILCTVSGEDYFKEIFNDHQYIKIISLSQNHIFLKNKYVQIFALQQKIVSPNYINVAILAFWWCILKDVKVIEFYGADFSFYQNLRLDQNTGEPTLSTDYFYLEEKSKVPKNTRKYISEKPKKMHERFYQIWLAFDQMSLLSEVARKKNLQVTNYSKNTSLDTIKRSI